MRQRPSIHALIFAVTMGLPICGCSKKDNVPSAGASALPKSAVQMNISGEQPIVLGPDTLQAEIDKSGSGVNLASLDLSSVGRPLILDAPEGAKVARVPRGLSLRPDLADVEIVVGDHFAIRIRLGRDLFDEKRKHLAGQKVLVNNKDLILSSSMLLLDERCEFARHMVIGGKDYTIENIDPLFGRQINHSQADCLLMLKCIGTLKEKMSPSPTGRG
jgi:hypothetical protein